MTGKVPRTLEKDTKELLFSKPKNKARYENKKPIQEQLTPNWLMPGINDGDTCKPIFLAEWEKQAVSGEEITDLEDLWNTPFVRDWLALQPSIAETDLGAVVYVGRETLPIVTAADRMSTEELALLEALFKLSQSTLTPKNSLQALPGRDLVLITERIIVRPRQEQKWGKPLALWAFLTSIDATPNQAVTYTSFLGSLDPTQLKAAIIPILGDKEWARDILDGWAENTITNKKGSRKPN